MQDVFLFKYTLQDSLSYFPGTGFGLLYLPSSVIVTSYFDKRLSLATSILGAGADVGTFTLSPIIHLMLTYFGWETTVKILGASVATCIPFCLLLKPFKGDDTDSSIGETDIGELQLGKAECDTTDSTRKLPAIKFGETIKSFCKNGNMYINLFLDIKFSLFIISNFLTCVGIQVPMVYAVVRTPISSRVNAHFLKASLFL